MTGKRWSMRPESNSTEASRVVFLNLGLPSPLRSKAEMLTIEPMMSAFHPVSDRYERTCRSKSAPCHKQTHAPQQTAALFDQLVGAGEQ